MIYSLIISLFTFFSTAPVEEPTLKFALLKYAGGGDWYANPTALTNLARYCNANLGTDLNSDYATVEVGSADIFNYPWIHMTGHGNVVFSPAEAENLRNYLIGGGFLHVDDNYGMDPYIRVALKQVFPESSLVELPFEHPIYHQKYKFSSGLPKVHEHDGGAPQGYGIVHEGRVVIFYSFECDLSDGWEDPEVHRDPPEIREKALQMGSNIVSYAFKN